MLLCALRGTPLLIRAGAVALWHLLYYAHMLNGERKPQLPRWAEQERLRDLAWLGQELPALWTVAQAGYTALGRGAVVIDTTQTFDDAGHPLAYLPQADIVALGAAEAGRMVASYEPAWQLVALLLKSDNRVSTYRLGLPS